MKKLKAQGDQGTFQVVKKGQRQNKKPLPRMFSCPKGPFDWSASTNIDPVSVLGQ